MENGTVRTVLKNQARERLYAGNDQIFYEFFTLSDKLALKTQICWALIEKFLALKLKVCKNSSATASLKHYKTQT